MTAGRGGVFWGVAAVLMAAFVALAVAVAVAGRVPGDRWALAELHSAVGTSIDSPMRVVGDTTDTLSLAALATVVLVALLLRRQSRDAALFVTTVAVVWLGNPLLKELVGRPRPHVRPPPEAMSSLSFPSGHASGTVALVGALLLILHNRRHQQLVAIGGVAVIVLVAFSRLALAVHYPSDIVGGWLWAGAWIACVAALTRQSGQRSPCE